MAGTQCSVLEFVNDMHKKKTAHMLVTIESNSLALPLFIHHWLSLLLMLGFSASIFSLRRIKHMKGKTTLSEAKQR